MKKLTQLFFLLIFLNGNSQDFGFTQISVSSLSNTNINVNVMGVSNCGTYLSHEVLFTGTDITLKICYYFCGAGIVMDLENDFQISIPNLGLYTLNIVAYESTNGNGICNYNNMQDNATINFAMPLNQTITLSSNAVNLQQKPNLYPNPTTGILNIPDFVFDQIELFDLLGKKVKTFGANNNNFIDITDLTNGIYFIKIVSSGAIKMEKILVQK